MQEMTVGTATISCFDNQLTFGFVAPGIDILPSGIGNEARVEIIVAAFSRISCRLPFQGTAAIVEACKRTMTFMIKSIMDTRLKCEELV